MKHVFNHWVYVYRRGVLELSMAFLPIRIGELVAISVLRVNITIVYEHTVCATSAFSICMLRVVFNVVLL